jgi:RNA polymerase sigma-70 factor (ECF subfamily)
MGGVCEGDQEALAALFRRYARIIRGIAYRVLRDRSEADDLLQDIFLLVHRLCRTFDNSKGSVRSWILQLAYRRALCRRRYLTSRHFYKRLALDEVADELTDPRTRVGLDDTVDGMFGAGKEEQIFAVLSESQRQTLRLHFIEGYTLKEIAQKLGQSTGNVKNHYFRGLEKLRKELLGSKLQRERAVS